MNSLTLISSDRAECHQAVACNKVNLINHWPSRCVLSLPWLTFLLKIGTLAGNKQVVKTPSFEYMYDLVAFRTLHMTSRCVSWTHGPSAAHYLLVRPSHPLHHLTTASKRSFSSWSSLISQLSNLMFPTLHFHSCLSSTSFPPFHYLLRKCWPLIAPKSLDASSVTHTAFLHSSYMGHQWYKEPQHWSGPFMPSTAQNQGKMSVLIPLTKCLEGSTHNNAAPHHGWYYLEVSDSFTKRGSFHC